MKAIYLALMATVGLSACGFKGDLYLPKDDDKQKFGVIQTGIGINDSVPQQSTKPNTTQPDNKK